jgi:hypothetical protein
MGAPKVLREIFLARKENWGDDDNGFTFEKDGERLDVFVYRASDDVPMTTFATIGMAARAMPGTDWRAELHVARRGLVSPDEENAIAVQLANLASHPWLTDSHFDWGHIIALGHDFPTFIGCDAVFFSGPFTEGGWDYIDTSEGKVKILNVVPITATERQRAKKRNPIDVLTELMNEVDIFRGREN